MDTEEILYQSFEHAEFCVIDTETTGLSAKYNNIIEIGLIKIKDLQIVDRYGTFVNPGRPIPYFITQLTGISDDDVYDAPFFDQVVDECIDFIGDSILVGHNLAFDMGFLSAELLNCGREKTENLNLCTLRLARRLLPQLKKKSLGDVCRHLGIFNKHAHRAIDDAEVTALVLMRMLKMLKESHDVDAINDLIHFQYTPLGKIETTFTKKKMVQNLPAFPHHPGVYCFLNSKNKVIYIGKAKSLSDRLRSYFGAAASTKAKKIVKQAAKLKIELTNSELTALLYEAESIKAVDPKMNVMLKRYGSKYFLRINRTEDFPTIELSNKFDFDGNDYFGLFISRRKAESVLEIILKVFLIRECTQKEFKKKRGCMLSEIDRCTGPCTTDDKELYFEELNRVYDFIYGHNQFALDRLLKKMKDYSDKMQYEKAGEMKEVIELILAQITKSALLSEPINSANVLMEIDEGFGKDYILLMQGKIFLRTKDEDYDFQSVISDYFEGTINIDILPDNEDLEKMKIALNWIIKNRNKVKIFYLKEFKSIEQLSRAVNFSKDKLKKESKFFNLSEFMKI
ncbi:MAG: exonuclease domain-containing protein [Bacteroidota bacterium]|nr:exonuclease domain-containing protein [Bacteroidota bacterium]